MASTTFTDGSTTIYSSWLNDVNAATYNAAGDITGSIARTAQAKFSDIVSVKDFGAVGNGVADDTAAIQAAITSFTGGLTGVGLYFPKGIYVTSSTLIIGDKQNMYMVGEGVNTTVIKPTISVPVVFSFGSSSTANQGISGMKILCSAGNSNTAVRVQNCQNFFFNGMGIDGANIGLIVDSGVIHFYSNFFINNSINTGIQINGGNDQFFRDGVLSSVGGPQPTTAGIVCTSTGAFWMDSVDAISQKVGFLLAPTGSSEIDWLFISNCAFDSGSSDGIQFAPGSGALIKGCTFTGCWTSTNDYGVNIKNTGGTIDGVRFIGHRSFNNAKSGYVVGTTNAQNIFFTGCDASGNSASSSGTYSGFDIGADVSEFSIIGCRSGQQADFSNTQSRGILINPGTSTNYTLSDNDVRGNVTNTLLDLGTGTTKIIKGNLGYNPIGTTSITVTSSPFTYTNNTGDTISIFVTGGTVSDIALSGNTVGAATNAVVAVPQQSSLVVTYSVAPTMTYLGY